MKNKKGFTLVELLAVITLLAVVTLIAVPAVGTISNNIKKNMCVSKMKDAQISAISYANDGNETGDTVTVSIQTLLNNDYLISDDNNNATYKNPINDYSLTDISIVLKYNTLSESYTFDTYKIGDSNKTINDICQ